MAFEQTIDKQTVFGDMKVVLGHVYLNGVTTGELNLSAYFSGRIISVTLGEQLTKTTPSAQTQNIAMAETFPLDSATAITLQGASGAKALFAAYGEGV